MLASCSEVRLDWPLGNSPARGQGRLFAQVARVVSWNRLLYQIDRQSQPARQHAEEERGTWRLPPFGACPEMCSVESVVYHNGVSLSTY